MLDDIARLRHRELSGGLEWLTLTYLPSPAYPTLPGKLQERGVGGGYAGLSAGEIGEVLAAQLKAHRRREIGAGTSLFGPHRDDLAFLVEGRDLRTYGSRGQQRTGALSLKLAEVEMMRQVTGESPLLLLDDVMSELDEVRRHALLDALAGVDQAFVTTTDWGDFSADLLAHANRYRVEAGRLTAA